ncbi:MAG TPA: sensor histidine kinase [Clostridia bacterium]|nr:sensor histidine kinase [Clostridia bacterium]
MNRLLGSISNFIYRCKTSIRYKFTIVIVFIVLIPMSLSYAYAYHNTYLRLKENVEQNLRDSISIIRADLEGQFDIINQTSFLFLSNQTIRSVLQMEPDAAYYHYEKTYRMDRELNNLLLFNSAWERKLLKYVLVYEDPLNYYFISRNPITTNFLNNTGIEKYLELTEKERQFIPPSTADETIYFIRNINDLNTQKYLGKLVMGINVDALSYVDKSFAAYDNLQIICFDNNGIIYSHTDKKMLGKRAPSPYFELTGLPGIHSITMDSEKYIASSMKISDYGMNAVVAIPENQVFANLDTSMQRYFIWYVISILFSLLIGFYLSSRVVEPLKLLTELSDKIKSGHFHEKMPPSKYYELDELSCTFNTMTDEIDHLINQVYEKQLLLKESELATLQMQINPHFFFNILETVSWEARFCGNDKIFDMTASLGQLMRACITRSSSEKITIGEELQYIENYLALQKIRFEDRMSASVNIKDASVKSYYLPRLCVLPLVENAIVHGLESKRGEGRLEINIAESDELIIIEVIDDGVGFSTEHLDISRLEAIEVRKNAHSSIGLYNSNKRIALMYGSEYGLKVESEKNNGTKVTVTIPIDKEGDSHV